MTDSGAIYPRPLSEREAEVLQFMVSPADPHLQPFREQAASAVVTGMCGCGCATIHLEVNGGQTVPESSVREATELRLLTETRTRGPVDLQQHQLLLFTTAGRLCSLELVWYDKPGPEFPPPDTLEQPDVIDYRGWLRKARDSIREMFR